MIKYLKFTIFLNLNIKKLINKARILLKNAKNSFMYRVLNIIFKFSIKNQAFFISTFTKNTNLCGFMAKIRPLKYFFRIIR